MRAAESEDERDLAPEPWPPVILFAAIEIERTTSTHGRIRPPVGTSRIIRLTYFARTVRLGFEHC